MKYPRYNSLCLSLWLFFLFVMPFAAQAETSASQAASQKPQTGPAVNLVLWSDIHIGEPNTNMQYWEKLLDEGLKNKEASAFIFSGDLVDNKNADEKIFQERIDIFCHDYVPKMLSAGRPLIVAYGNNDFYKNYNTEPDNMRPVMDSMKKAMGEAYYLDELGNGVYPRLINGVTFITMNSLIFSAQNSCPEAILKKQREDTMNWLKASLAAVPADSAAVIVCHVPPCVDAWNNKMHWDGDYMKRFHQILADSECSVMVLSGHTHTNEIHAYRIDEVKSAPIFIVSSIAQKYGYNAAYRTARIDFDAETGVPVKISWTVHYANPTFGETSVVINEPCSTETVEAIGELLDDDAFYFNYMEDFYTRCTDWREKCSPAEKREEIKAGFKVRSGWKGGRRHCAPGAKPDCAEDKAA
ncbi:metallophosphoesterase [bacterium]|nr:metallophosphoesterase [bacterium]